MLDATGKLARRWWLWGIAALLAFSGVIISSLTKNIGAQELLFVVSCAASSFFLLSIFLRFSTVSRVWKSLSRNAYGMYLVHYVFVVWLQYFLLRIALSAVTKGLVVFIGAVSLSWMTVGLLGRLVGRGRTEMPFGATLGAPISRRWGRFPDEKKMARLNPVLQELEEVASESCDDGEDVQLTTLLAPVVNRGS